MWKQSYELIFKYEIFSSNSDKWHCVKIFISIPEMTPFQSGLALNAKCINVDQILCYLSL